MSDFAKWLRDRYGDSHNPMHDEEYDLANLCAQQHEDLLKIFREHGDFEPWVEDATFPALRAAEEFQEKYG